MTPCHRNPRMFTVFFVRYFVKHYRCLKHYRCYHIALLGTFTFEPINTCTHIRSRVRLDEKRLESQLPPSSPCEDDCIQCILHGDDQDPHLHGDDKDLHLGNDPCFVYFLSFRVCCGSMDRLSRKIARVFVDLVPIQKKACTLGVCCLIFVLHRVGYASYQLLLSTMEGEWMGIVVGERG